MVNIYQRITDCIKVLQGSVCDLCHGWHRKSGLCEACLSQLPWQQTACQRCAYPLAQSQTSCGHCTQWPAHLKSAAVFSYLSPVDWMLAEFKYKHRLHWVNIFAPMMANLVPHDNLTKVLLPVPSAKAALMSRGFNPPTLLARAMANSLGLEVITPFKCEKHKQHAKLSKSQRQQSAQSMFVQKKAIIHKRVILVDDILTTGSTLLAMVQRLKYAGVMDIQIIVLARTLSK